MMNGMRKYTVPAEVPGSLASKMLRSGVNGGARGRGAAAGSAVVWLIAIGYLTALGRVARQMTGGGIGNVGRRRKQSRRVDKEVVTLTVSLASTRRSARSPSSWRCRRRSLPKDILRSGRDLRAACCWWDRPGRAKRYSREL